MSASSSDSWVRAVEQNAGDRPLAVAAPGLPWHLSPRIPTGPDLSELMGRRTVPTIEIAIRLTSNTGWHGAVEIVLENWIWVDSRRKRANGLNRSKALAVDLILGQRRHRPLSGHCLGVRVVNNSH